MYKCQEYVKALFHFDQMVSQKVKRAYSWDMKLKNETLNNSNRYLTGDELDILLGNVHDPCKYQYFLTF